MSKPNSQASKVRQALLSFTKRAAEHNLTSADGRGGSTDVSNGAIPMDPNLADVKKNVPATGALPDSRVAANPNPSLTVADARQDTMYKDIPVDPNLKDVKQNLPKSASERVAAIAAALGGKPAAPAKSTTKQATAPANLDELALVKVARAVLATEEGYYTAVKALEKSAGAEVYKDIIRNAIAESEIFDAEDMHKRAAAESIMDKAAAYLDDLVAIGCTDEIADVMLKQAALHEDALQNLDELEKIAYAAGVDDAAAMEAAALGEEGEPPMEEAIPMGGEEANPEEVMGVIQELLDSGEITEEELAAAIEQLQAEGGGEAAPAVEKAPPLR